MRSIVFDSWAGVAASVLVLTALSVLLLPPNPLLKGMGLLLVLAALGVSLLLQVRAGRRSTWDVIQAVDQEPVPVPARALSGTVPPRGGRSR